MPLETQNPAVTEAGVFPFLGLQLAISPRWSDNPEQIGAMVSARFVPFRITEEGAVERLEDQSRNFATPDMFAMAAESEAMAQAVGQIMAGLQAIITLRGI